MNNPTYASPTWNDWPQLAFLVFVLAFVFGLALLYDAFAGIEKAGFVSFIQAVAFCIFAAYVCACGLFVALSLVGLCGLLAGFWRCLCRLCCTCGAAAHIDIADVPVACVCGTFRRRHDSAVVGDSLADGGDDKSPGVACGAFVEAGEICRVPAYKRAAPLFGGFFLDAVSVYEVVCPAVPRGFVADVLPGTNAVFLV